MKRGKKSHYAGISGRASCGAHVPSYRVAPRGRARVTRKVCTQVDRLIWDPRTGRRVTP